MKMASLTADIRRGDETQSLLRLQQDGVSADDFVAIAWNDAMRADIVAAIIKHRLFTRPEDQIQLLLEINEAVWKDTSITEAVIRALGDPPDCPASNENGLFCINLFRETGNAVKTFSDNWDACVHVHGTDGTWKWNGLLFTKEGVQQRENVIIRPVGLRWQVAELGRQFQKQCVENVRPQLDKSKTMGMGQELPFVAALHPKWAVSTNGDTIPFVDAPDMEVAPSASGGFSCAPCLDFGRGARQVCLHAGRIGGADPNFGSGSLR